MRKVSLKTGKYVLLLLPGIIFASIEAKADQDLSDHIKVGDIVQFGRYWQSSQTDDWSDIEWRVLEREEDSALLLSEYCLEAMPYQAQNISQNSGDIEARWEDCSLRYWLNQEFYTLAFSEEEKKSIKKTSIHTEDNDYPETAVEGGPDTEDYVFLLDKDEVIEFFDNNEARQAQATDLVIHGDDTSIFVSDETDQTVFWWLRSTGDKQDCVQAVGAEGSVVLSGFLASRMDIGVRPAIWVNVSDSN